MMAEITRLRAAPERLPGSDPADVVPGGLEDDGGTGHGYVTVSSGLYHERLPLAGTSVAELRRRLAGRLDIDPNATPVINGQRVHDEERTRVGLNQLVAFIRLAGEKGSCR
jgi:hypothetical protein